MSNFNTSDKEIYSTENSCKEYFIRTLCDEIKYKKIRPTIANEYRNHIDELTRDLIEGGLSPETACNTAVERMGNPCEIGKALNKTHKPRVEWSVLALTSVLVAVGMIILFNLNQLGQQPYFNSKTLLTSTVIGGIALVALMLFDYKKLERISLPSYVLVCVLLACFYLSGIYDYGNSNFFISPSITLRVPTLAIPLLIIFFAGVVKKFCTNNGSPGRIAITFDNTTKQLLISKTASILILLALAAFPVIIMFTYRPAFAVILFVILIAMMTYGIVQNEFKGNKIRTLAVMYGLITIIVVPLMFWTITTKPYVKNRIFVMLRPANNISGENYQSYMSQLFLSAAKPFGSTDVIIGGNTLNVSSVPYMHTDFIFTAIAAQFGWMVALGIVVLFALFIWRIISSSHKMRDYYARSLAVGICAAFAFQISANILVSIGMFPIASVNLPFISYGGAALVCNMALVGLLLGLYRRKDILPDDMERTRGREITLN